MNTMDSISARCSYRGNYHSMQVPRDHLKAILEAGCTAPSGCNMQTTSFIAVDDPEILEKLHSVFRKPLGSTAPALICVLTQEIPSYHGRIFSVQDYSAAIENMLLAITELGYASCWVEGYVTDSDLVGVRMAQILGVPENYRLVAYLPVGIPAELPRRVSKKAPSERSWFNGFGKNE